MNQRWISSVWLFAAGIILSASNSTAQVAGSSDQRAEIRLMGGWLPSGELPGYLAEWQPAISGGVEGSYRLTRLISATGRYGYDHLGSNKSSYCGALCSQETSDAMHEFLGGLRVSAAEGRTVEPYVAIGAGGVRRMHSYNASYAAYTVGGTTIVPAFATAYSNAQTNFAVTIGGGAGVRLTRRAGLVFDVSAVGVIFRLHSAAWLVRPSAGFYYRF